jgi:hypothetical protein
MDKVNSQMGASMPPTGQRSGTETEIAVPGVQDSTDNVGLQCRERKGEKSFSLQRNPSNSKMTKQKAVQGQKRKVSPPRQEHTLPRLYSSIHILSLSAQSRDRTPGKNHVNKGNDTQITIKSIT